MAESISKLQILVQLRDEASTAIRSMSNSLSDLGGQFGFAGDKVGALAGVLQTIGAGAILKSAISAFAEAEVQMTRFDAILKTLPPNLQALRGQILAVADEALNKFGFDNEEAAVSIAKLLQATNDGPFAFQAFSAAMDLARYKGIGLEEATQALILAFQGNARLLKQFGIEVDDHASKETILAAIMRTVDGQAAASNILPEQTLGRGLRRMFFGRDDIEEYVSVIGTPAFMEFVESIKAEGVELEKRKMDRNSNPITPIVIEIDSANPKKDVEKLDIELPILTPRIQREYKNLNDLDIDDFKHAKVKLKEFSAEEKKEIVFQEVIDGKVHHVTVLESSIEPSYQSAVGFFVQSIMRELRLFGCYDILFGKVKDFIQHHLFDKSVDLMDANILRNLSETEAKKTIIESFKKAINDLTVQDVGDTELKNYIKLSSSRPFVVNDKSYLIPKKSVFNKIVGDSQFELEFADFLERSEDVVSFAKNYYEVHFKIDYKNASGSISYYYPDFIVKIDEKTVYIVETKGREDLDDIEKIKRLAQWCDDANEQQHKIKYHMLYVKQEGWDKYRPKDFVDLIESVK